MTGYKDKKHSLIGQVSKGEFGAKTFLKMERKRWLANFVKGMLFGCEQPFFGGSVAWHPKKRLLRRLPEPWSCSEWLLSNTTYNLVLRVPTSFLGSYLFSAWEEIKSWERGWPGAWPIALRILGTRLHDLSLLLHADQKMFRVNGSSRAVRFMIGFRELETSDVFTKICRKRQLFLIDTEFVLSSWTCSETI